MESNKINDSNVLSLLLDKVIYTIILKNYYINKDKKSNFIYDDDILYIHFGIYFSDLKDDMENNMNLFQQHLTDLNTNNYEIDDVNNPFDKLIYKFYSEYKVDDTIEYLNFNENNINNLKYFLLGMVIGMNYSGITTKLYNSNINLFLDNLKNYLNIDPSFNVSEDNIKYIQQSKYFNYKSYTDNYCLKLLNINKLLKKLLKPFDFNYNFTMDYKQSSISVDEFNKMFFEFISNPENKKINNNYNHYLQLLLYKLKYCSSFEKLNKIYVDVPKDISTEISDDSSPQIIDSDDLEFDDLIDDNCMIRQLSDEEDENEDENEDNYFQEKCECSNFDSEDDAQHIRHYIPSRIPKKYTPMYNPGIKSNIRKCDIKQINNRYTPSNIINLKNKKLYEFQDIDTSEGSNTDSIEFKPVDSDTESICIKPKKHYKTKEINETFNEYTIDKLLKLCKSYHKDYVNNTNIIYNNRLLFIILILIIINILLNITHFYY